MHVSHFGHGTLKFRHADPLRKIIKVRVPKILGGQGTPQQVVLAHLKWVRAPKFVTTRVLFLTLQKYCVCTNRISRENVVRRSYIYMLEF